MGRISRIRWLPAAAATLAPLALLVSLPGTERVDSSEMGILVPAYFHPSGGSGWQRLAAAASEVPITAILNPASGPGSRADPNYAAAIDALREAGGRVVGYVHTRYGLRPFGDVAAEIDRYMAWYDIDGIFVDEMSNSGAAGVLNYYGDLYAYAKEANPAWEVIGNPGTNTHESHLLRPTADRFVVTENTGPAYAAYTPSAWNFNHAPLRFGHLVHTEPSVDAMAVYLDLASSRNAGLIYMTDDTLPNPWNTLPSYWDAEVSAVAAINRQLVSGDYNGSGAVEQGDLDLVLLHWGRGAAPPPAAWICDLPQGTIDQSELDGVLLRWGSSGAAAAIAEPSTLTLMLTVAVCFTFPVCAARRWLAGSIPSLSARN